MQEKPHATRAWTKQRPAWNPSVEYKCVRDVLCEVTWPKSMPCIGEVIPGMVRLIDLLSLPIEEIRFVVVIDVVAVVFSFSFFLFPPPVSILSLFGSFLNRGVFF